MGFPGGSDGKESACSAGDPGSVLGSERSPAGACGNPLQYSCLENSMDRESWRAIVHGVTRVRPDWVPNTQTPIDMTYILIGKLCESVRNQSYKIKVDFLIRGNKERMDITSALIFIFLICNRCSHWTMLPSTISSPGIYLNYLKHIPHSPSHLLAYN